MKTRTWTLMGAALAAAASLVLHGCEDSVLTAPTDGAMILRANPSTVIIDPNTQQPNPDTLRFEAQSSIEALVVDAGGAPQEGISVFFSSSAGRLASAGAPGSPSQPVKTDSAGIARDVLTVTDADPPEVVVTAQSSALSDNVTVSNVVIGANELPRASVTIVPRGTDSDNDGVFEGPAGSPITFDGSASLDPDGTITCYQWTILSDNPDAGAPNPILAQGPAASGIQRSFVNEQTLAVTLMVSDDPSVGAQCDPAMPPVPENLFSPFAFRTNYEIVCSNDPPVAVINGPDTITITLAGSTPRIILDGRPSFDPEGLPLDAYLWNCGGPLPPQPKDPPIGSQVECVYQTIGTYTATLRVRDRGTGQINPNTGNFECQKISEADSVTINVVPPTSP